MKTVTLYAKGFTVEVLDSAPGPGSPVDPPPPPPPPASGPVFKSVSKTAGTLLGPDYAPQPAAGQRVEFSMHGSGGGYDTTSPNPASPSYFKGDKYVGICNTNGGVLDDMPCEWHVVNAAGYAGTLPIAAGGVPPFVSILPVDRVVYPNGRAGETLHLGYRHGASHAFTDYTSRRYRAILDTERAKHPEWDWTRCISGGVGSFVNNSMGAWAMFAWAAFQPDFAACFGSSPRLRATTIKDWEQSIDIATPAGQLTDDGALYAVRYDFAANLATFQGAMPFIGFTWSTGDAFAPDTAAAIPAFRARIRDTTRTNAQRSGFATSWVPGVHGAAGPGTAMLAAFNAQAQCNRASWIVGKGYPVFDRCSLDADPASAPSGTINANLEWDSVVESASGFSCRVKAPANCTVEVWPHSQIFTTMQTAPKAVSLTANVWQALAW